MVTLIKFLVIFFSLLTHIKEFIAVDTHA